MPLRTADTYHPLAGGVLRRIGIDAVRWLEENRDLGFREALTAIPSRRESLSEERDFWLTIAKAEERVFEPCRLSIKIAQEWHKSEKKRIAALSDATEEVRHEWLFHLYAARRCRKYLDALEEVGDASEEVEGQPDYSDLELSDLTPGAQKTVEAICNLDSIEKGILPPSQQELFDEVKDVAGTPKWPRRTLINSVTDECEWPAKRHSDQRKKVIEVIRFARHILPS